MTAHVSAADLQEQLERLLQRFPLPPGWSKPQLFSDTTELGNVRIRLVGLASESSLSQASATGSAGEPSGYPLPRAYFELVERCAVLDALCRPRACTVFDEGGLPLRSAEPDEVFPSSPPSADWTYSRSNGVAAALDWASACRAARAELAERDRLLRSWFGEVQPNRNPAPGLEIPEGLHREYEFRSYEFPPPPNGSNADWRVAGVIALPRSSQAPLSHGFGAGDSLAGAMGRAARECIQRIGFLWGEAIPESEPPFEATANYHQEMYLWPAARARLERWLEGEPASSLTVRATNPTAAPGYVDLTPEHLRNTPIRIAKAMPSAELPLTFGLGHPHVGETDPWRQVHPIA